MASRLLKIAWIRRLASHIPPEQFGRYLLVGAWNTLFGYRGYAVLTFVRAPVVPHSAPCLAAHPADTSAGRQC
ncbi:MAG TPA: hypothetical protein VFL79_17995 [Terriglobia bacterium]|nr:hypothetical protein [Terriglobia bacterium]